MVNRIGCAGVFVFIFSVAIFVYFGFFDFEEIEPMVIFGNIDWLGVIYAEYFATIVAVEVANDDFFVTVFPDKIII